MNPTIIMPNFNPTKTIQEKVANTILFISLLTISVLALLDFNKVNTSNFGGYLTLSSVAGVLISMLIIRKYSSWKSQYYKKLEELGYVRLNKEASYASLGVFRKDNVEYDLYLCREGVFYFENRTQVTA